MGRDAFYSPNNSPSSAQNTSGIEGHMLLLGQMKQNSQTFVTFPFGDEKKRKTCCWIVVQWAHKHHIKTDCPVSFKAFVSVSWWGVWVQLALMAKPQSSHSEWALLRWHTHTYMQTHLYKPLTDLATMHHPSITRKLWGTFWLILDNKDRAGQRCLWWAWHSSTFRSVKMSYSLLAYESWV